MPLSDVRLSETSAQNVRGKNFQKFVFKFSQFSYFVVLIFAFLVVGHENCENLDLTKILRYTVLISTPVRPLRSDIS